MRAGGRRARSSCAALILFVALASPILAAPSDDLMVVGRKAFADGQYSLAVTSFQKLRDEYPESPSVDEASYLLGVSLFYSQNWPDCLSAFALLGLRHPSSAFLPRAAYWMGAANLKLGNWQSAYDSLTTFLRSPGGASTYVASATLYRAVALEGLGRDPEAAAVYRQILVVSPDAATASEVTYRLAGTEFRAGRYAAARDLFGKILLARGSSAFVRDAVFFTGECELALGNLDEAGRRYRTILSLYGDSPYLEASTFRLADISWRQKKDGALGLIDGFLARFPTGSYRGSALRIRADILRARGRAADALQAYGKAVEVLPDGPERQSASYSMALGLLSVGKKKEAADAFGRAQTGGASDIAEKAGFQRAVLLADLGDVSGAIDALRSFLKAFPASPRAEEAGRLLGILVEKQGDPQASRSTWDWLARTFPDSPQQPRYVFMRASSLLALGLWAPALDDFQALLRDSPGTVWSARSTYAIGYVYAQRGEYPRALTFFQAAARDPLSGADAARARLSAAVCLFDIGRFDQASSSFRALLEAQSAGVSPGIVALYAGRSLYRTGRLADAAASLSQAAATLAAEGSVQGADAQYWRGWALLRQNKPAEACSAFLAVAEGYPSDPRRLESLFRAGVCRSMDSDDASAVTLFAQVASAPASSTADAPFVEQAMYEQGLAYARLGDDQKSLGALEQLARRFPGSRLAAQALYGRAEKALAESRFDDARAGFDRVVREFPGSNLTSAARYWSAESLLRAGNAPAALDGFWAFLAPEDPGSSAAAARPPVSASLAAAAIEGFAEAMRRTADPDKARRFADLARSRAGLGVEGSAGVRLAAAEALLPSASEQARALAEAVVADAPPEPYVGEANLLLGVCAASSGDWTRALGILGSLESSRADEVGARAALEKAHALEAMGRTADAVDEYLKVSYLFPDFPDRGAEGMANAVRLSRARGDSQRAARIEEALRKAYPQSPWLEKTAPD